MADLVIIGKVAAFLGEPLPYANRDDLKGYLVGLEALGLDLAKSRVEALKTLHEGENKMLYPKDKELTELDRRIKLQAAVAELKRDYDYLVALEELIERRIKLGTELLVDAGSIVLEKHYKPNND